MHDVDAVDATKRSGLEHRRDDAHTVVGRNSNARDDASELTQESLRVEPFPFSHVSANEKCQIEIQVGDLLIDSSQLNKLGHGDVVKLDASVDEDVIVWSNGRRLAKGKLVVANGRLAVRLAEQPNLDGAES